MIKAFKEIGRYGILLSLIYILLQILAKAHNFN